MTRHTVRTAAVLALLLTGGFGPASLSMGAWPGAALAQGGTSTEGATLARGRDLAALFYAVKVDQVWAAFTPDLRASWGTVNDFRAYREMGVREYGAETRIVEERVVTANGLRYYVRSAVFAKHPDEVWAVVFGFNAAGRVERFSITLAYGTPEGDDTRTERGGSPAQ